MREWRWIRVTVADEASVAPPPVREDVSTRAIVRFDVDARECGVPLDVTQRLVDALFIRD